MDHKRLGILYICYALVFLLVAGFEAMLIRMQLFFPHNDFISPFTFNRLFTMHGTTMVFLVGMPILFGFGNYLVPLMIGARDMAFPRLNAFSFWISAFAGLLLYYSFIGGVGLRDGVGAGCGVVCLCAADGAGVLAGAHGGLLGGGAAGERDWKHRHGDQFSRDGVLHAVQGDDADAHAAAAVAVCDGSFLVLVAVSPLTAAQAMLLIDRYLGGHFFDTQAGGSAILWAHFFWIFGHPEVYVLVLPAFAFANEIIPVFSRKAIFGYPAMVAASVGIAFISLSVWAHHMFTIGMTSFGNAFFTLSTMLVSIPTGIKTFNWLATIWGGKIRFATPMLFSIAFLFQFVIAGLTGIMLSISPWNWQMHNSYFVVAHFHYVLVGAIVFMIFAAIYYWYPKMTGRMLDERLGKWHFWLMVIGFHMTFDVMHIPGLLGMPRQIFTYEPDRGWTLLNQIVSVGGFIQAIAVLIFVYNLVHSYFRGAEAGPDPWDAWTLEWSTSSPPPAYNFAVEPVVASRRPLWDLKHPEDPDSAFE